MKFRLFFGLALGLANIHAIHAMPISFGFTGSVTQVPADDPGGGIGFGSLISGQFTFDSTASDGISDASQGSYFSSGPAFGMALSIGGNSYTLDGFVNVGISNGVAGSDQYGVLAYDASGSISVSILLEDLSGSVFSSDALPMTVPPMASFALREFHFSDTSIGDVQIDGLIDTLTCEEGCDSTVPEPGTLALLGAGLLAAALRRQQIG